MKRPIQNRLTQFTENYPRRWEFVKAMIFVLTIFTPMIIQSIGTGRIVWGLFVLFPIGLFYFIPGSIWARLVLGWSTYITMIIIGTKTKKLRIFALVYIIVIGLVLINLQGCAVLMREPGTSTW